MYSPPKKIPIFATANETLTSNDQTAMNAPLRTYRPPAAGTQNHRNSATTRVAPFAHLPKGTYQGKVGYGTITGYLLQFKNYSGKIENPVVVLKFNSIESVQSFQNKFNKLFHIK